MDDKLGSSNEYELICLGLWLDVIAQRLEERD